MTILNRLLFLCTLFVFISSAGNAAYANCSDPAGKAGTMDYFSSDGVYKFCDGTDWHSMKGGAASGDDVASKDYVDAAVAAGTSGNYSAPTEWDQTSTSVNGGHNGDCSSLGADWRMGNTIDLYYLHMRSIFPVLAGSVWITVLPDYMHMGNQEATDKPRFYRGFDIPTGMTNDSSSNCEGWSTGASHIKGSHLSQGGVATIGCNVDMPLFCVR